jgi:NAD(P)-dependent dehydrogenase (short-subunit alcohol dehydrogenase family)
MHGNHFIVLRYFAKEGEKHMIRFDDQVAVVTGSGRGLGEAYARLLAERGARVVVHDAGVTLEGQGFDANVADRVVNTIIAAGGNAIACYENLETREGCQSVVECALAQFGRLDILINNAGWVDRTPLEEMTPELLTRILAIQIAAPLWLAQAAFPAMKRQHYGRIVLTSSGLALWTEGARPELSGYAIGKAAQIGLMNALAANSDGADIRVNIISPVAATRIFTGSVAPGALRPEQVAPGVAFLASNACTVSGIILRAGDGHFSTMRWHVGPEVELGAKAATPETIAEQWEELSSGNA